MAAAGMLFLLVNAVQDLSGAPTTSPFGIIGIALVVIGAGIVKYLKKNETQGTR